jgi:serine/threonine-protein kinase HipA
VPPELKYQKEGGPSLQQCFTLVREASSAPVIDLKLLLDAVIFNYLIGNCDAHGKNFSLLYRDGEVRLAPLYDFICTLHYPELSADMAMKIGGVKSSDSLNMAAWNNFAQEAQLDPAMVRREVVEIAKRTTLVLNDTSFLNSIDEDAATTISELGTLIRKRAEYMVKTEPSNDINARAKQLREKS